jgi:hypothetical protein
VLPVPGIRPKTQFADDLSALSMTMVSTGARIDSGFKPSCSRKAVNYPAMSSDSPGVHCKSMSNVPVSMNSAVSSSIVMSCPTSVPGPTRNPHAADGALLRPSGEQPAFERRKVGPSRPSRFANTNGIGASDPLCGSVRRPIELSFRASLTTLVSSPTLFCPSPILVSKAVQVFPAAR